MVLGTPATLGTLRDAVISRCQLDSADPRAAAAVLNPIIVEAVQRFDMADPHAWPWDYTEIGAQTITTGTADPFTWALSAAVSKVRYVLLSDVAGTWQYPLERLPRQEQLDRFPLDSQRGVPRTFALGGVNDVSAGEPKMACFLRPLPDVSYRLIVGGIAPVPPFSADSEPAPATNDYQIDDWSALVVEYAAHLVYRAREDLSEAISAKADFDSGVLGLRRSARRTYGAGIPGRPLALDPDLQR